MRGGRELLGPGPGLLPGVLGPSPPRGARRLAGPAVGPSLFPSPATLSPPPEGPWVASERVLTPSSSPRPVASAQPPQGLSPTPTRTCNWPWLRQQGRLGGGLTHSPQLWLGLCPLSPEAPLTGAPCTPTNPRWAPDLCSTKLLTADGQRGQHRDSEGRAGGESGGRTGLGRGEGPAADVRGRAGRGTALSPAPARVSALWGARKRHAQL